MKKTILILMAVLTALTAAAWPVDPATARRAATSFVENTLRLRATLSPTAAEWTYSGMYLFSLGEDGFLIASADDAARPVLAYSLGGAFAADALPPTLQGWLDTYEAEIALAQRDSLPTDPAWATLLEGKSLLAGAKDIPAAVGPLVTTQWGQYAPYNGMCPSGVPSGCVATATSQVMRYWNYPAFGQGSHSYNCATFGNQSADFAHTRYDWSHMPNTAGTSSEERTAVALLTYHVGVSVNMDYNYTQSGATTGGGDNCALEALRRYFHYNGMDISYHSKGSTSDSAWTDFLMDELRREHPILYDGVAGAFGGHSFICDGYDSLRMLHFNLGEFGEGDGFYAVGAIIYMQYNLNGNNSAIVGIHPEYGLYVSDSELTFHRSGGDRGVWVATSDTCAAPWTATASESWIVLGGTDFDRLGEMTVSLTPNTTGAERTGTVTLSQGPFITSFTVRQAAFDPEDFCSLTVSMESMRNQAWSNGAHLSFESVDGFVYATATHSANSSSSTQTVSVAPLDVMVRWIAGGPLDRYYNYAVVNAYGDTLVKVDNAYYNGSDTLLPYPCARLVIGETPNGQDQAGNVVLFPNPATDFVEVTAGEPVRQVVVHDMAGRLLHSGSSPRLDTRAWPAGIYLVAVVTENTTTVKRLTKQ